MPKQIRVKRWRVRVLQDSGGSSVYYTVYAVDQLDARIIAYVMDGGVVDSGTDMLSGEVELVKTYTEII